MGEAKEEFSADSENWIKLRLLLSVAPDVYFNSTRLFVTRPSFFTFLLQVTNACFSSVFVHILFTMPFCAQCPDCLLKKSRMKRNNKS